MFLPKLHSPTSIFRGFLKFYTDIVNLDYLNLDYLNDTPTLRNFHKFALGPSYVMINTKPTYKTYYKGCRRVPSKIVVQLRQCFKDGKMALFKADISAEKS